MFMVVRDICTGKSILGEETSYNLNYGISVFVFFEVHGNYDLVCLQRKRDGDFRRVEKTESLMLHFNQSENNLLHFNRTISK